MAKSAQEVSQKFVTRASAAAQDYVDGAKSTTKDQSARAIASKTIYQQALQESFGRDAYAKGLQKSGKQGWTDGVEKKGRDRYAPGVQDSASKYATESGRFDTARRAADNLPTGLKGSATNLAKVAAVMNALRAVKLGK